MRASRGERGFLSALKNIVGRSDMKEIIINELMHLIGVAVAVVLGFAIGFERKLRYKEAGIRTHAIVCVGAALIMVVSRSEEHTSELQSH